MVNIGDRVRFNQGSDAGIGTVLEVLEEGYRCRVQFDSQLLLYPFNKDLDIVEDGIIPEPISSAFNVDVERLVVGAKLRVFGGSWNNLTVTFLKWSKGYVHFLVPKKSGADAQKKTRKNRVESVFASTPEELESCYK